MLVARWAFISVSDGFWLCNGRLLRVVLGVRGLCGCSFCHSFCLVRGVTVLVSAAGAKEYLHFQTCWYQTGC
jgi:hypothetical protein